MKTAKTFSVIAAAAFVSTISFAPSDVLADEYAMGPDKNPPLSALGNPPIAADNPTSAGKVELGKMLFFDPRVGGDASTACSTCHEPKQGWAFADGRELGNIFLGARYHLPRDFHLRVAFSHNHEVPGDVLFADPVGSLSGTASGIRHRSGVEVGVGWSYRNVGRLPFDWLDWLGAWTEASVQLFPDASGPRAYVLLEYGLSFDVGRWPSRV